jgi:hypothetical protein
MKIVQIAGITLMTIQTPRRQARQSCSPRDFVVFTPKTTFQQPAGARRVQDESSSRFSLLLSMIFSGKSMSSSGRGPIGVIFRIMP